MSNASYEQLRETYKGLPGFKELVKLFKVELAGDNHVFYEIRHEIMERVNNHINAISSLLLPENALSELYESNSLTEEDKTFLLEFFRKLKYFQRKSLALDLEFNEKAEAEFIREFYNFWQDNLKELRRVYEFLAECWKKDWETPRFFEYLG